MKLINLTSLITMLFLMSACSNRIDTFANHDSVATTLPEFNDSLVDGLPTTISADKIIELNEHQQRDFFQYFNDPINQGTNPNLRAYNYLSLVIDRLHYSDETLTAEQTLIKQSGNCLSLANLTKAIAKLANIDIAFHLMENNPVFNLEGNYLTRTDHIRAVLKGSPLSKNSSDTFNVRSDLRIDYFATGHLRYVDGMSKSQQTSLYFSNLAVDFLIESQYSKAFAHAAKALDISPHNSSALNVMGILHRRFGDLETAQEIYSFGAENLRGKATFLRNLTALLESQGRHNEAELVSKQIIASNKNDPWYWIRSGLLEHSQANFGRAIKHYDRALAIAPDLDRLHLYLAKAHNANGAQRKSQKHLMHAIEHAQKSSTRSKYKAKLRSLKTG